MIETDYYIDKFHEKFLHFSKINFTKEPYFIYFHAAELSYVTKLLLKWKYSESFIIQETSKTFIFLGFDKGTKSLNKRHTKLVRLTQNLRP